MTSLAMLSTFGENETTVTL